SIYWLRWFAMLLMRGTDSQASMTGSSQVVQDTIRVANTAPLTLPLTEDRLCFRASGRELLRNISFTGQAGAFNIILGPNGAGKSLLLRLCHGLLRPHSGHVMWNGHTPV